jgi:WD40 repeat protein
MVKVENPLEHTRLGDTFQKMLLLPKRLHRMALFEEHSDSVLLGLLPTHRNLAPRTVSQIRHHTSYQAHVVLAMQFIDEKNCLVTSSRSPAGSFGLSFWDLSQLDRTVVPPLIYRMPTPSSQSVLLWSDRIEILFSAGLSSDPLYAWDLSAYKKAYSVRLHKSGRIIALVEVREQHAILTASTDGTLCVWDYASRTVSHQSP